MTQPACSQGQRWWTFFHSKALSLDTGRELSKQNETLTWKRQRTKSSVSHRDMEGAMFTQIDIDGPWQLEYFKQQSKQEATASGVWGRNV